ncbi:hypothetical protein IIY24_01430 [Candidatus Saccharibacteria bacterium]|nr:hypothetical protein [Candidatus Saccharibacteria bacterium]
MNNIVKFENNPSRNNGNTKNFGEGDSSSILQFSRPGEKLKILKKERSCPSPVVLRRVGYDMATISFRLDCFNTGAVELGIGTTKYGQSYYEVYFVKQSDKYYQPFHKTYLVWIDRRKISNVSIDEALRQVVDLLIGSAYKRELAGDLYDPSLKGASILSSSKRQRVLNSRTVKTLEVNNLVNMNDLVGMTREELCDIPGLSTYEVHQIEKVLTSNGLSLRPSIMPSWYNGDVL